ncbi:MAG TPA: PHP domain-containing protein, partial [Spirochaetia bacterium]|nr:PHP domain-containing protein [Spirochaetia bacterium]
MIRAEAMKQLSGGSASERLAALEALVREHAQEIREVPFTDEVNNHVHTVYSFSPYSPTLAALMARLAGLRAVGSVDHDSIGAAREMIAACKLLSIGSTVGCELRVNFSGTRVEGRRLNNPDSLNIAYMVIHGVPEARIDEVAAFLSP